MILTRKQESQVKYLILSIKPARAAAILGHEFEKGSDVAEVLENDAELWCARSHKNIAVFTLLTRIIQPLWWIPEHRGDDVAKIWIFAKLCTRDNHSGTRAVR